MTRTILSLRERIGFWLCHRMPWDLDLMTCGKPRHLWSHKTEYDPKDCPMCELENDVARLHKDKCDLLEKYVWNI